MKKYVLGIIIFLLMPSYIYAEEYNPEDSNITNACKITINNEENAKIIDADYTTFEKYNKDDEVNITCEEEIGYVYIYYHEKATSGNVNNQIDIGVNGFLHELVEIKDTTKTANIKYNDDYAIADIYVFNKNTLPKWVEKWEVLDKADLMLISSHADDEQLFFAGLLPKYVSENKKIEVIYFTNHYNNTMRYHEQLEGLWTVGIKYYPVISTFPDAYSESLEDAISNLKAAGYTEEDAMKYLVTQIRRYKPSVIVGHDEKGEYGHGQHILSTYILKDAITKANDNTYDEESFKKYGTFETKKLYLHLYGDTPTILDYDTPLDYFDGKTAYEVSKEGFSKHHSQQFTWFTSWLNGENGELKKATEIKEYNPAVYGLYFSSVGEDKEKTDLFENIKEDTVIDKIIEKPKKIVKKIHKSLWDKLPKKELSIIGIIIIITSILLIIFRPRKKKKRRKTKYIR